MQLNFEGGKIIKMIFLKTEILNIPDALKTRYYIKQIETKIKFYES